jgi:hypothetical protein
MEETLAPAQPIRDLGLTIKGTPLERVIADFEHELDLAGILKVRPRFYLSSEWGVPFPSLAIAIPFYLATPELTKIHADRHGHVEGASRADILRYLRHEMGHVISYCYRLHDDEEWVKLFGSMTQPYVEEYRPEPFSRRFVRHLPGWYAQKHPDEDWAETFAVWMTPGLDWRNDYAEWPSAMAKLLYCDRVVNAVKDKEPLIAVEDFDEDVAEISYTLDQYYTPQGSTEEKLPRGMDGALRAIFEDEGSEKAEAGEKTMPAREFIERFRRKIMGDVYLWTGHFPERTGQLLLRLAERAEQLGQVCRLDRQTDALIGLTTLVTALAMNHVAYGDYAR